VPGVFGTDVESVDVVEIAVPSLGYYGKRPPVAFHVGFSVLDFPCDDGVADYANAVRVCDHDGAVEKAGVVDPGGSGHFSVTVQSEPGGEDGVIAGFPAGMDGGDAGADWTFADYQFAFAGDERGVAYFYSFDVGDGVVGAGSAVEGNSEIAGSGLGLGECLGAREDEQDGF